MRHSLRFVPNKQVLLHLENKIFGSAALHCFIIMLSCHIFYLYRIPAASCDVDIALSHIVFDYFEINCAALTDRKRCK